MNPDQFHNLPEDVMRDERIRRRMTIDVTADDLNREAEAEADRIRTLAKEAAETAVKGRVEVKITESGRIRKNGPCPCGSGRKFKKCCLGKVREGELTRVPRAAVKNLLTKGSK